MDKVGYRYFMLENGKNGDSSKEGLVCDIEYITEKADIEHIQKCRVMIMNRVLMIDTRMIQGNVNYNVLGFAKAKIEKTNDAENISVGECSIEKAMEMIGSGLYDNEYNKSGCMRIGKLE